MTCDLSCVKSERKIWHNWWASKDACGRIHAKSLGMNINLGIVREHVLLNLWRPRWNEHKSNVDCSNFNKDGRHWHIRRRNETFCARNIKKREHFERKVKTHWFYDLRKSRSLKQNCSA